MDCHRLVLYSEVNSDGEKSEKSQSEEPDNSLEDSMDAEVTKTSQEMEVRKLQNHCKA